MNTSDPSEVYPGSLLIPPEEAAVIDVKQLSSAKLDDKEQRLRLALDLPSPAKGRHL
jgi:hypothetical protein